MNMYLHELNMEAVKKHRKRNTESDNLTLCEILAVGFSSAAFLTVLVVMLVVILVAIGGG